MQHEILEPVGARVSDLSLDKVTPEVVHELTGLLAEYGVLVFPRQDLDDEAFVDFLGRFGELVFTAGETPVDGFPDLNVITNTGRLTPPRSSFHVDSSYLSCPPAYTALRTVTVPAEGGQTLFTNQYRAYETLPAEVRNRLRGRTVRHVVTGVGPGPDEESAADHPLFIRHPVSGRTALYLSTPQRCVSISGLRQEEAGETIRFLLAHSTRDDNLSRHTWSPGDVVMWDNACVLHKADHSGVVGDRTSTAACHAATPPRPWRRPDISRERGSSVRMGVWFGRGVAV